MEKFSEMIRKESSLRYVNKLVKESDRMLPATLEGDTRTMNEVYRAYSCGGNRVQQKREGTFL